MGSTKCRRAPTQAQVRAMFPAFCGISGSTKTMFNPTPTPSNLANEESRPKRPNHGNHARWPEGRGHVHPLDKPCVRGVGTCPPSEFQPFPP